MYLGTVYKIGLLITLKDQQKIGTLDNKRWLQRGFGFLIFPSLGVYLY